MPILTPLLRLTLFDGLVEGWPACLYISNCLVCSGFDLAKAMAVEWSVSLFGERGIASCYIAAEACRIQMHVSLKSAAD